MYTTTHPEFAVLIYSNVAGLEVPVHNTSRVNILQPPEDLVHEELDMLVCESLLPNYVIEI